MAFESGTGQDIDIKVRVDASGSITVLNQLGQEIAKVDSTVQKSQSSFKGWQANLIAVNQGLELAGKAVRAFKSGLDFIADGARIGDIAESFEILSRAAGVSADVLRNQLSSAVAGTVDNVKLMQTAISGMRAGLKPDELVTFTQAARVLSEITGTELPQALQTLQDAYSRGAARGLKDLNIYAEQGKTISETQRNIMAALQEYAKMATAIDTDAGDAIDRLGTSLTNLRSEIAQTTAQSETLRSVLAGFADITESWTTNFARGLQVIQDEMDAVVAGVQDASNEADMLEQAIKDVLGKYGIERYKFNTDYLTRAKVKALDDEIAALVKQRQAVQESARAEQAAAAVRENIAKKEKSTKLGQMQLEELEKRKKADLAEELRRLNKERDAANRKMKEEAERIEKLNSFDGYMSLARGMLELKEAQDKGLISLEEYNKQLEILIGNYKEAGGTAASVDLAADISQKVQQSGSKGGFLEGLLGGATGADMSQFGDEVAGDIAGEIATSNAWNQVGQDIGRQISEAITVTLGAVLNGESVGASQVGGMVGGIGGTIAGAVIGAAMFSNPITAAAAMVVGASIGGGIGTSIGNAIGAAFQDKDSPGTAARKAIDKWFGEILRDAPLTAIIEGKIQQIEDLVTKGNQNREQGEFATLPEELKEQFDSLGLTLETVFNSLDLGLELGVILANNLGGELNNVQMLLEACGLSAENLYASLEKAFLSGKITVEEYLKALREVDEITKKGIPNQIGAVTEAWENWVAALKSENPGRALVDSMQDIAAEARELGINTFPELVDYMVNVLGLDKDMVMAWLEAIKNEGIKTLEELENASTATTANIAANTEAALDGDPMTAPVPASASGTTATATPRPSYGGGGGGRSKADEARQELEQRRQAVRQLVEGHKDYLDILERLKKAEISYAQATKLIRAEYKEVNALVKKRDELEKKAEKQLMKNGFINAKLAAEIARVNEEIEKLTENLDEGPGGADLPTPGSEEDILTQLIKGWTGNVDQLRIAMDALGLSMGNVKSNAIKAFMLGQMSAGEAAQQLNGGITGKYNDVSGAFGNLAQMGLRGGAFTMDALRSIAAEVREGGGKTLDDVINMARSQGVSQANIDALMQGLRDVGITSLDQLSSMSDETAIMLLDKMSQWGFAFEETGDDIRKLLDDMAELDKTRTTTIKVNIQPGDVHPAIWAFLVSQGLVPGGIGGGGYASGPNVGIPTPGTPNAHNGTHIPHAPNSGYGSDWTDPDDPWSTVGR